MGRVQQYCAASSIVTPNNYRFQGEQWDADFEPLLSESGYLDPNSGRLWTLDTFEGTQTERLSLHKYLAFHEPIPTNPGSIRACSTDSDSHDLQQAECTWLSWEGKGLNQQEACPVN